MWYREIGKTGVKVSEISFGCWTLGGLAWNKGNPIGWAEPDEKEAVDAVHYAVDHGVNHFDNADVYGHGRAERTLAKALEGISAEAIIATKVGHFAGTAAHAYTPLHIRQQCEQSLENLKRECIDIYYFHHGDFGPDDRYVEGAVETMRELRQEGKIRLVGLSAYSAADFVRLVPKVKPDVLQTWAHAMDDQFIRPGNPVPRLMEARGISLVAFSPLNQGILLDKYNPKKPPTFEAGDNRGGKDKFKAEALKKAHEKLLKVKRRFGKTREDLARVALQFVLAHRTVACPIPGFRNLEQAKMNIAAAEKPLTAEEVEWLRGVFAQ